MPANYLHRHRQFADLIRIVADGAGASVNEFMVAQGWARDWRRYSGGAYADEEAQARANRRGLWGLACPADLWGNRNYN